VTIYLVCFYLHGKATDFQNIGSNLHSSMVALIIFVSGLFAGLRGKLFAPLRWVASISYPLYLLHVPLAWGMIYILASMGVGMYWSATISSAGVIVLAWTTHWLIELPSQAAGKNISKLVSPPTPVIKSGIA
jgi:peptidoglycan/LPS O-acetylase OafA/YrhL